LENLVSVDSSFKGDVDLVTFFIANFYLDFLRGQCWSRPIKGYCQQHNDQVKHQCLINPFKGSHSTFDNTLLMFFLAQTIGRLKENGESIFRRHVLNITFCQSIVISQQIEFERVDGESYKLLRIMLDVGLQLAEAS